MHPDLLFLTLDTGVPLEIARLQAAGVEPLTEIQKLLLFSHLQRDAEHCLYGGTHAGKAMADLIQLLAHLALAPGGVHFGPCHWEGTGETSRGPRAWPHARGATP